MKIICISGKAQHGKDTTAGYLKEFLEERGKKVLICHYGDLVKYVCKTFFGWDGQKDEKGRTLLQRVGTDVIRAQDPDYWVRFIGDMLMFFYGEWDYVLIPDCRFPNEVDYLKNLNWHAKHSLLSPFYGKVLNVSHIRVIRENFVSPLTEEQQKHPSETALDEYPYDYLLYNDRDLDWHRTTCQSLADGLAVEEMV